MKRINTSGWYIIPLSIFLLALALRFIGIAPGYIDYHPDEPAVYGTAIHMLFNRLEPNYYFYPAGVPLLNLIVYISLYIPIVITKAIFTNTNLVLDLLSSGSRITGAHEALFFGPRLIHALYLSRFVTAAVGVFTVVLAYFVGKRLWNKGIGAIASFFLAVNFRHVMASKMSLPDLYNGFFSLLVLYFTIGIWQNNKRSWYIATGITMGVAFSMKYHIFFVLPVIASLILLAFKQQSIRVLFSKNVFVMGACAIVTALLINPYLPFHIDELMHEYKRTLAWYGFGADVFLPYHYIYLFQWGIGQAPSIAVIVGIFLMAFQDKKRFLLIFSFVAAIFYIIAYHSLGGLYTRNYVTVIPFLMVLAAFGVWKTIQMTISKQWRSIALIVAVIFINLTPLNNSIILSQEFTKPWSSQLLHKWLIEHIPDNSLIRTYNLFLGPGGREALMHRGVALKDWTYSEGPHSLSEFQDDNTKFTILNTDPFQISIYTWRQWEDWDKLLRFGGIPIPYLENSYYGLSVRELRPYTVFEAYKKWQAHNNPNYVVYKIPSRLSDPGTLVLTLGFDESPTDWKLNGTFLKESPSSRWDSEIGVNNSGSLVIEGPGGSDHSFRISSKPVEIKEGMLYTAKAMVRSHIQDAAPNRNAFLRLDFYKTTYDNPDDGIAVNLSSRALGDDTWQEVQAQAVAPKGAKYMTVSVQNSRYAGYTSVSTHIDDITLYESSILPNDTFPQIPYIPSTIPVESIYSHAFL